MLFGSISATNCNVVYPIPMSRDDFIEQLPVFWGGWDRLGTTGDFLIQSCRLTSPDRTVNSYQGVKSCPPNGGKVS